LSDGLAEPRIVTETGQDARIAHIVEPVLAGPAIGSSASG
jgi:hypothetical protein